MWQSLDEFAMSQGAQAVGMGKEAQSVGAAGELYKKANDILGYVPLFKVETFLFVFVNE